MSAESLKLYDFIQLGESHFSLRIPQVANIATYLHECGIFLQLLETCGFERTRTAAGTLEDVCIKQGQGTGEIHPAACAQLKTLMNSITRTLNHEAESKGIIITRVDNVPIKLLELPQQLGRTLAPHQEALRQDVIACLKVRAFRPAIVMAWALGFDLVREWLFNDSSRLADFNSLLKTRTQKTGSRQVTHYRDFFRLGESFILDICSGADGSLKSFTSETHRKLQSLLDDRNEFAHANYENATEAEATAYIERMIRVLLGSPFC